MGHRHVPRDIKKQEKKAFKAEKLEAKEERSSLVIHNGTRTGNHNCPFKDAGNTHAFRARCLKLQHGGYCPACGEIFGWNYGCREHGYKQEALLAKCPSEEEKTQFKIDNDILVPDEEENQDENQEQDERPVVNGRERRGRRRRS